MDVNECALQLLFVISAYQILLLIQTAATSHCSTAKPPGDLYCEAAKGNAIYLSLRFYHVHEYLAGLFSHKFITGRMMKIKTHQMFGNLTSDLQVQKKVTKNNLFHQRKISSIKVTIKHV